MKKMLTLVLALALMLSCSFVFSSVVNADYELYGENNLLDVQSATFEGGLGKWVKSSWTEFKCGLSVAKGEGIDGSDALLMDDRSLAWLSSFLDISPIILANGTGEYSISCYIKVSPTADTDGAIRMCFRDDEVVEGQNFGNYGYDPSENTPILEDEYTLVESIMEVTDVDAKNKEYTVSINSKSDPNFEGLDEYTVKGALFMAFDIGAGDLLIDNVCIVNLDALPTAPPAPTASPTAVPVATAVPTATPVVAATTAAAVATPTATAIADDTKGNSTLVIVLISAGVLLAGGAAAFFLTKGKKNGGAPDDTSKGE